VQLTPEAADALVPDELQALACLVLNEAVRNAVRHSTPSVVRVGVIRESGTLTLSVLSEGPVRSRGGERIGLGVGLSLAAAAAEKHDGNLEWGPLEEEQWRVRLTVPITSR
jgi:signal transduction histidine kinase